MSKTLFGHQVELQSPVSLGAGDNVLDVGLQGNVVWDEGGESVIVRFADRVPNGGFPTGNVRETWLPRSALKAVGRVVDETRATT